MENLIVGVAIGVIVAIIPTAILGWFKSQDEAKAIRARIITDLAMCEYNNLFDSMAKDSERKIAMGLEPEPTLMAPLSTHIFHHSKLYDLIESKKLTLEAVDALGTEMMQHRQQALDEARAKSAPL